MKLRHLTNIHKRLQRILSNRPNRGQHHPCSNRRACHKQKPATDPILRRNANPGHRPGKTELPQRDEQRCNELPLWPQQESRVPKSPARTQPQEARFSRAPSTGLREIAHTSTRQAPPKRTPQNESAPQLAKRSARETPKAVRLLARPPATSPATSKYPSPAAKQNCVNDFVPDITNRRSPSPANAAHTKSHELANQAAAVRLSRKNETVVRAGRRDQSPITHGAALGISRAAYQIRTKRHHNPRPKQKKHFNNSEVNARRETRKREHNPNSCTN